MAAVIPGVAKELFTGTTSGVLYTDRRDFYPSPNQFAELFPSVAPFLTFSMRNNFRTGLADPVFKLFEFKAPWERQYLQVSSGTTIAAAGTGAAAESTAVTFDISVGLPITTGTTPNLDASMDGVQFEVWSSDGGEKKGVVILTDAETSTTALFKNLGETAIITVDNDKFVAIGQATGEGMVSPDPWASELAVVWNQCQIFRTSLEVTGTLQQASLRGATKELARLRGEKAAEHKMRMERAFLFGASPLGTNLSAGDTFSDIDKLVETQTGTTQVVRTTTGIVRAIELYGSAADGNQYQSLFNIPSATYTYGDFIDDLEIVFQYVPNSGSKPGFVGSGALGFWSKKVMSSDNWGLELENRVDELGAKVKTLLTPHGDINLNLSHAMKYEHKNQMLIVDPRNIEYVEYRPSRFSANIKTDDGYDGIKDEYFSDAGLGITNIKAHQLFNIGGGA